MEGIFIKGQFNLLTLQMWKLRIREGDTLGKITEHDRCQAGFGTSLLMPSPVLLLVTRLPPGASSPWVCNESICPYSSFRDEKTELDPEIQADFLHFGNMAVSGYGLVLCQELRVQRRMKDRQSLPGHIYSGGKKGLYSGPQESRSAKIRK